MHNNMNVNVSGPMQPASTYKTVVLKGQAPFASQVTEPNMKYVIKHDFDLGSGSVTIPEDCLLEFDGGAISNGTLVGQNTILIYNQPLNDILTATLEGTWRHERGVKADEEDITDLNGELKFKDKAYTPANYSGLGRKILRKNLVNGVNTLTQNMINQANTVYVIQYDFTLGEDITISANCVLEFDGGSISGEHTITGVNTGIEAGLVKIFNINVTLAGSWNIAEMYLEWFGGKADNITDNSIAFRKAINLNDTNNGGIIKLLTGIYKTNGITTGIKTSIIGQGIGATIICITDQNHGIHVPIISRAVRLEEFTLKYNTAYDSNNIPEFYSNGDGIHVDDCGPGTHTGENHNYIEEVIKGDTSLHPAYSWLRVKNIAEFFFNDGIYVGVFCFNTIIENSLFLYNNKNGINFLATDSEIKGCYTGYNKDNGLYLTGSNVRIENVKSIFNNYNTTHENTDGAFAGINILSSRNLIVNCETQDNFCSGFNIFGRQNVICNCISNTDGYSGTITQKYYNENYANIGFNVNYYNNFVNCVVTSYLDTSYLRWPIYVSNTAEHIATPVDGISVIYSGLPVYNKSFHLKDILQNKGQINIVIDTVDNYNIIKSGTAIVNNINGRFPTIYMQFKINDIINILNSNKRFLEIYFGNTLTLEVVASIPSNTNEDVLLILYHYPTVYAIANLGICNMINNKELVVAFYPTTIDDNKILYRTCNTRITSKGYTSFYHVGTGIPIPQDVSNISININPSNETRFLLNKIILTSCDVEEKDIVAGYLPNKNFYNNAQLYISADSYIHENQPYGSSTNRPNIISQYKGFQYFDTTLGKPIYWNGTAWVDATGTPV